MTRYRFRLDPVLRVRRAQEEMARQELAQANRRAVEASARHRSELERYLSRQVPRGVVSRDELVRDRAEAALTAATVDAARLNVEEAFVEVATRHSAWSEAAKQVAMLERLDARRRDEHQLAESRAEIAALDDATTGRVDTAPEGLTQDDTPDAGPRDPTAPRLPDPGRSSREAFG